ncbi:MAG: DUF167 family protein [Xanthobacteraceae bacterium]
MTRDPSRPWTVTSDGIVLTVRLTPKGGRDAIEGIDQMADGRSVVKARVRAAASEGEANAALVSLIARTLAVPPSRVTLIAGAAARIKRLNVMGDTGAIAAALERIMGVVK